MPFWDRKTEVRLIVGLGNPGAKYTGNRHNIGFMAVDAIAGQHNFPPFRKRFQGQVSEASLAGVKVILLKPETYMNESGRSVQEAAHFYKLTPDDIAVTERLARWLDEQRDGSAEGTIIYACGPEPMLAATAKLAAQRNIECQVSMERRMACGIGVCQSCAVECRVEGSNETIYKLCCQDGPVFDSRAVVFNPPTQVVEEVGLVRAIKEGLASPTVDEARILEALEHGEEKRS